MSKPIDLVVGKIVSLEQDRCAGWEAFYKKDRECCSLKEELKRINKMLKELKKKRGI